jgi:hypothetical protein
LLLATPVADSSEEFPSNPPRPLMDPPGFGDYGCSPDVGWNDTTLVFRVNFTLSETPINLTVRVYIDTIPNEMHDANPSDTNYIDGKDYYWMNMDRLWAKGIHNFYFYIEADEQQNTTNTLSFEILNRAPYILSPPPMTIYVDEIVTYEVRVQDDDLDPIDGELVAHNFTAGDWHWMEWYPNNLTFMGKPKQEFVRWLNITIWDSYDQLAWYRWTITCIEGDGGGDTLPSPKWFPEVPIWR